MAVQVARPPPDSSLNSALARSRRTLPRPSPLLPLLSTTRIAGLSMPISSSSINRSMLDLVTRLTAQPSPTPQLLRKMYGPSFNSSSPASLSTPTPTFISQPSPMADTMRPTSPRSSIRRTRRLIMPETLRLSRKSISRVSSLPTESRSHIPSLGRSPNSYVMGHTQYLITTDQSARSSARKSRLANVSSMHATTRVHGSPGTSTCSLSPTPGLIIQLLSALVSLLIFWTAVCLLGFTAALRSGHLSKNSSSTPTTSVKSA